MSVIGFNQGSRKPKLRRIQTFLMDEIGLCFSVQELLICALGLSHCTSSSSPPVAAPHSGLGSTVFSALLLLSHEHRPFSLLAGEECAQSEAEEKTCPFSEKNPHCSTAIFISYLNANDLEALLLPLIEHYGSKFPLLL